MRFKNVIFDFGGIIVDLDRQAAVDAFEALGCRVAGSIGLYAQKGVFAALETGRMADAEFFGFVRTQAGRDIPDDDIRGAWRPRVRTFMLSNTNALHWDYVREGLPVPGDIRLEDCFERMFLSFRMHLAKPDAGIFLRVLSEAGLRPGETLFIDDSEENCRAAETLGMQVFHSRRTDDWVDFLRKEAAE